MGKLSVIANDVHPVFRIVLAACVSRALAVTLYLRVMDSLGRDSTLSTSADLARQLQHDVTAARGEAAQ